MHYLIKEKTVDTQAIKTHIQKQLNTKRNQLLAQYSTYNISLDIDDVRVSIRELTGQQKIERLVQKAVERYYKQWDGLSLRYRGTPFTQAEIPGFCHIKLRCIINNLISRGIQVFFSDTLRFETNRLLSATMGSPTTFSLQHPNWNNTIQLFKSDGVVRVGIYQLMLMEDQETHQIKFMARLHPFTYQNVVDTISQPEIKELRYQLIGALRQSIPKQFLCMTDEFWEEFDDYHGDK